MKITTGQKLSYWNETRSLANGRDVTAMTLRIHENKLLLDANTLMECPGKCALNSTSVSERVESYHLVTFCVTVVMEVNMSNAINY